MTVKGVNSEVWATKTDWTNDSDPLRRILGQTASLLGDKN